MDHSVPAWLMLPCYHTSMHGTAHCASIPPCTSERAESHECMLGHAMRSLQPARELQLSET